MPYFVIICGKKTQEMQTGFKKSKQQSHLTKYDRLKLICALLLSEYS